MIFGLALVFRWSLRLAILLALMLGIAIGVQSVIAPVSTLMLARWATGQPVDRRFVPLSAIASSLKSAVILSEDGQFCRHHGVDWGALREVVRHGRSQGPSRGASTITMQVVKNLFLWPGRSYLRKGIEIPLAMLLDLIWGKRHVLEAYLNVAEWGDGVFGIEAAAEHDFGMPAAALSPHDAALLATALPNPFLRRPAHPSRLQRALAARIMRLLPLAADHVACIE